MATVEQTAHPINDRRLQTNRRVRDRLDARMLVYLASLAVFCQLPFLLLHFNSLWDTRPHYKLFPIYLVGLTLVGFARFRRAADEPTGTVNSHAITVLFTLCLLFHALGVLLLSPALALIAFSMSIPALTCISFGAARANAVLPCSLSPTERHRSTRTTTACSF